MNELDLIPQDMPNLKLRKKSDDGFYEDIYLIEKIDGEIVITPLRPIHDIFPTLTLYCENIGEICEINMSEIVVNVLKDTIERKFYIESEDANPEVDKLFAPFGKIKFKEYSDRFIAENNTGVING